MEERRLTFTGGTSHKFWSVRVDGADQTTSWGRIGTEGQTKIKTFNDAARATASAEKQLAEKLAKGYVEDGDHVPAATPAPPPPSPPPPVYGPDQTETPPPPPPLPPPGPAPGSSARSELDLRADEWAWATWRPLPPAPGLPRPFDRAACVVTLRAHFRTWDYGRSAWSNAPFVGPITAEEGLLWLTVLNGWRMTATQAAKSMTSEPAANLTDAQVFELAFNTHLPEAHALAALIAVLGAEKVAAWLLGPPPIATTGWRTSQQHANDARDALAAGVRPFLLPALDAAARQDFIEKVGAAARAATWPQSTGNYQFFYDEPDVAFFLAAQCGLHDLVEREVASWPDDRYRGDDWNDHYHRPQQMIFGARSPDLVRRELQRLGLPLKTPDQTAAWLAHTELDGLEHAGEAVAAESNREDAAALMSVLTRVVDRRLAPIMLDLTRSSKAPAAARGWIQEHPFEANLGAADQLIRSGKARDAALTHLRARRRAGDDLTALAAHLDPATAARLTELVIDFDDRSGPELPPAELPPALQEALTATKRRKLPGWVDVTALPPLALKATPGHLASTEVESILHACATIKPDDPPPDALASIVAHIDPDARDAFGWAILDAWLTDGAPSKDKWAMLQLGYFGGDLTATRLAPMIRAWPGESQHQRAVLGLGVLGAIGTDTALMLLSGMAQKLKFKALQTRAREAMDEIAAAKGMTKAELEDRIVPDCSLDERGSRTFDFGPRQFSFVLGPGMKPMVRDESGKVRKSLPKPGARDGTDVSERATADWRLLRKQVGDVAKVQAARLEQVMVTQRRWTLSDFEHFLVRHPLQQHLVRLLVWGAWDGDQLVSTFRVTDELDYADSNDEAMPLDAGLGIGIMHPLQLSDDDQSAWGEILGDYEIVPPFPQLGRPVHRIDPADSGATDITRYADQQIPAAALVRMLETLGWERGAAQDAGIFFEHAKPFPALGVTVALTYGGVPMGYMVDWEDQAIESCYVIDQVLRSAHQLGWGEPKQSRVPWGKVDPIVYSEVIADLEAIMEKAR